MPATMKVGDRFTVTDGEVEIVEYVLSGKVLVSFEDGTKVWTRTDHLREGILINPNTPSHIGVGFKGQGKYDFTLEYKDISTTWRNMLKRCYDPKVQEKHPTYIGCSVAKEWHNYQNFSSYFESRFTGEKRKWELDKDILVRGNKVYSEATCCVVPSEINRLFIKSDAARGSSCIGVSWHTRDNIYQANCNVNGKQVYLGYFSDEFEAFLAYKTFKEAHIKSLATRWRDQIDPRAYEALMNYEVLITD